MKGRPGLIIYAGPCSYSQDYKDQFYDIAAIKLNNNRPAIYGTRVVGIKSRTFDNKQTFMGSDVEEYIENRHLYVEGASVRDYKKYKSAIFGKKLFEETGIGIATEIVSPLLQLPIYSEIGFGSELFIWNPSVMQLGWGLQEMAAFALKYNWTIGVKNGKWVGLINDGITHLEKTWIGLTSYISSLGAINHVLIHRGVDKQVERRERNIAVHEIAASTKRNSFLPLFFDPSHIAGPDLREDIIEITLEALQMKDFDGNYLYNGLLIEVGESYTDSRQHITIDELKELVSEIIRFRDIKTRNE